MLEKRKQKWCPMLQKGCDFGLNFAQDGTVTFARRASSEAKRPHDAKKVSTGASKAPKMTPQGCIMPPNVSTNKPRGSNMDAT